MRSNAKVFRSLGMLMLVAAFALVAGGCGGGGNKSSSDNSNGGKTYPLLRVSWDAPDYMDPGLYYTVAAYQADNYVWAGLLGYRHTSGPASAELVPYLAEKMPTVSADGMNLKFKLRANLKYSDGTDVKASDFRYTIERDFKIDSPGVGFFSAIKGVSGPNGFETTKKGHISGIITDDAARTIEIQLDHPEGDILYILALEFAHFVPTGTPASDQSTHPIPSTGPYMLQNYVPNRSFTLVRNPNYNNQIPTMPSGAPDKVVGKIITDPVASYQSVVSGQSDYDYNQVPNDRLPEAQSKYKDQLRIYTNANTWYYFLNNKIPPFNNLKARQAVNYAIDRQAIVSGPFGGLGRPTENFLPPGYPQYKKITDFTFDLAKGSDLLVVDVTARPGVPAEQLEQEVALEIDAVVRDGVADAEVERAVALIQTMFVSGMQEAGERADKLSMFATYFGDPNLLNEEVDRYRAVTAEQVNAFVVERLGENNRASLVYVPREEEPAELVGSGAAAEQR